MALEALKNWTSAQKHVVAASFLGWMLDAFDFFLLVFVIPDIAKEFKVGVPAVVVTTTKFAPIANRMSSDFGMPNVRTLVLPHPLGGTDRDTLWRWADAAVEQLEALFTGSPPTPDSAPITRALDQVRAIVQADGSDLELVGATDGTVWLRLVIEDASCADCVMPKDILEATALRMMQVEVPAITRVDIDDPRSR